MAETYVDLDMKGKDILNVGNLDVTVFSTSTITASNVYVLDILTAGSLTAGSATIQDNLTVSGNISADIITASSGISTSALTSSGITATDITGSQGEFNYLYVHSGGDATLSSITSSDIIGVNVTASNLTANYLDVHSGGDVTLSSITSSEIYAPTISSSSQIYANNLTASSIDALTISAEGTDFDIMTAGTAITDYLTNSYNLSTDTLTSNEITSSDITCNNLISDNLTSNTNYLSQIYVDQLDDYPNPIEGVSDTGSNFTTPSAYLAQTFLIGGSGRQGNFTLKSINAKFGNPTGDYDISIRAVGTAGTPTGADIVAVTSPITSLDNHEINLPPMTLTSGENYALIIKNTQGIYKTFGYAVSAYDFGASYISSDGSSWSGPISEDTFFQINKIPQTFPRIIYTAHDFTSATGSENLTNYTHGGFTSPDYVFASIDAGWTGSYSGQFNKMVNWFIAEIGTGNVWISISNNSLQDITAGKVYIQAVWND